MFYLLCHLSGKRATPKNSSSCGSTSQQLVLAVNDGTLFAQYYTNTWSLVKSTVSSCTTHHSASTSYSDSDTSDDSSSNDHDSGDELTDVNDDEDTIDKTSK
jgi:hypothetical protein